MTYTRLPEGTIVYFVLGGPGCGKGTQCAKIVSEYGYVHLSVGDLLRQEVASGSAAGKEVQATMAAGGLVPPQVAMKLLNAAMLSNPASVYLVDGFPRQLYQAHEFELSIAPVS